MTEPMIGSMEAKRKRRSGILLHPTCLPGPDGIGDLGQAAFQFVDWLEDQGQSIWQVLPLGPTSYGDSPYQCLSAMAGNPLLISLDKLVGEGWLKGHDLEQRPEFSVDRVEFGRVITWKTSCLDRAWTVFNETAPPELKEEFSRWRGEKAAWLDDFVLFMALKEEQAGSPWTQWPTPLRDRQPEALTEAAGRQADRIGAHAFRQWVFFRQWQELRDHAAAAGIQLMGDIPIFVAHDSCDVWSRREFFQLDEEGRPTAVAGVPPDYFSETGQLWGNPLYDWAQLKQEGYRWWLDRVRVCLQTVDQVRIDHFRGFAACWEVAAGEKTAVNGRWVRGPGADFFRALQNDLGDELPIVAEDLGVITSDVEELRDRFGLPGMKVLQFAWSGPENLFQPHNYQPNCVVYSGTHDNDPTLAWWNELLDEPARQVVREYLDSSVDEPHWALIRLGMLSCARTFIAPLQDVLGLGREGRMNLPGEGTGNWDWRLVPEAVADFSDPRLVRLTRLSFRHPDQVFVSGDDPAYRPENPA